MQNPFPTPQSLERALATTEADADAALKAAENVGKSLRRFRSAARDGNLRDLRASLEAAEKTLATLQQQFTNAKLGWDFDEERYFAEGSLVQELIAEGKKIGLNIVERDERIYSYPALLRVAASDRAVLIDRKPVRTIRPSALAKRLRDLQRRPVRVQTNQMLQTLYRAYQKAVAVRGQRLDDAPVVPLVDIYELLTLRAGQSTDYPRPEFARDVYLLDQTGEATVRDQARMTLVPPRENFRRNPISVVTADGTERGYYAIAFTPIAAGSA